VRVRGQIGVRRDGAVRVRRRANAAEEGPERSEVGDSFSTVTGATEMRMVVRHRTLSEIVAAIEEYFVKAADAGDSVSELLEASRAQLDRNFQQLKSNRHYTNCAPE
uniref:DUF632 domain-containing protein n=1 Tax=Aegilops tauschii subsp. strangulata TaxID=200361 RepID=A0A452YVT2_AEGTS